MNAGALLVTLGLASLGYGGWRLLSSRLQPLGPADGRPRALALFLVAWLLLQIGPLLLVPDDFDPSAVSMRTLLLVQAAFDVAALLVVLLLSRGVGGPAGLGLRPHVGGPAWLLAPAAWLAYLPVVMLATVLNTLVLHAVGVEDGTQEVMRRFLSDAEAQRSPWVWLMATGLLPACEEILYRGVLHGGLRRVLPLPVAIGVSSLVFGLAHEPTALLPTATLGVLLALTYERTGSLLVPWLVHSLHNGLQLLLVTLEVIPT